PAVSGFLHRAADPAADALIMTHGAGSNSKSALLITLAEAFAGVGFTVLRCDLPYRQARPYGPPRPGDAERDRAGLKNAVAAMRGIARGRIFLGGQSYGGRQATMLCAEEPELVDGLLLTSYPLHAPSRPERPRIRHLPSLRTPALFVHGTRDPFGSVEEMQSALKLIPAKTKLLPVNDVGHELGFKGKSRNEGLASRVLEEFQTFFG
ncbi:MAG TPA: alpha/beta fold hydrolase, partial [Terriglobales bacterium]|nr:alpha/beta fold hydrolase [Terriglobales bacterium]